MLATVFSRAQFGMRSPPVTIDVHTTGGLPALTVVGLPEAAVKEAKDRVRSAVTTCGFRWPPGRVTVNLSRQTSRRTAGDLISRSRSRAGRDLARPPRRALSR